MPLQIWALWIISALCLLIACWGMYTGNAIGYGPNPKNRDRNPTRFWASEAAWVFVGVMAAEMATGHFRSFAETLPK